MRSLVFALFLFGTIADVSAAGRQRFPYEAIVISDNAEVRCGPGRKKYYATSKLKRGDRVMVRRHDAGGWYQIDPPANSFSWIRADYVRKLSARRGTVKENNVVVRVGSELGGFPEVMQRRLLTGDEVEIIGEHTFQTKRGATRMYKIKPPEFEWRWISAKFVTTPDKFAKYQRQHAVQDPFGESERFDSQQHNSRHQPDFDNRKTSKQRTSSKQQDGFVERKLIRTFSGKSKIRTKAAKTKATNPQEKADRQRLEELDELFRKIIKLDTKDWDFSRLEQNYRKLKQQTKHPAVASDVDLRLDAVARYQKTKNRFAEFINVTSKTDQRDAQLLAAQNKTLQATQSKPRPVRRPQAATGSRNPTSPQQQRRAVPRYRQQRPVAPNYRQRRPVRPNHRMQRGAVRRPRKFDGAGVIQRAAIAPPGAPRHVLMAPNGRVLAYLQAGPGVDLDRFRGQSMGVYGRRWHRAELRSDYIIVNGLTHVRLGR